MLPPSSRMVKSTMTMVVVAGELPLHGLQVQVEAQGEGGWRSAGLGDREGTGSGAP